MTNFVITLVIIIAAAGGFFFYTNQAEAPAITNEQPQENAGMNNNMVAAPTVTVDISGKNFEFSQKEIRVKQGDIVQVNFTSGGGLHDWAVDEFSARTAQVRDGAVTSVTFSADKKGTFEYYCSVGQHRTMGMVGKLIVE